MSHYGARTDPKALTPRERQVLDFMRDHESRHGCLPANQAIAVRFNLSRRTVESYRVRMAQKGALVRNGSAARFGINPALRVCPHCGKPLAQREAA